jgi:ArsR family transcriptional regulator, virulence genes transcriptional regulator
MNVSNMTTAQTDRQRNRELFRMQAEICQTLADPTRLEILQLLSGEPKAVKELVEETGQRQAKISQHLTVMRQRGIVEVERVGVEMHYSLADPRILDACKITREMLLDRLTRQGDLARQITQKGNG